MYLQCPTDLLHLHHILHKSLSNDLRSIITRKCSNKQHDFIRIHTNNVNFCCSYDTNHKIVGYEHFKCTFNSNMRCILYIKGNNYADQGIQGKEVKPNSMEEFQRHSTNKTKKKKKKKKKLY